MRHCLSLILLAAVSAVGMPSAVAAKPADCKLTVKGKVYISGVCEFTANDGGSFQISGGDYFAYVSVNGASAGASWNADPAATHAHTRLGTLTRKGACWVGAGVEICARGLPAAKVAAITAARPDGFMIYPEIASQSCVGALGERWQPGVPLVLRNCKLPGDKVFLRTGDTLTLDKHPGLCIGLSKANALVLEACDRAPTKWTSAATSLDGMPVQSNDGLCWTIAALADANAKFPFSITAEPCGPAGKSLKFHFAKD